MTKSRYIHSFYSSGLHRTPLSPPSTSPAVSGQKMGSFGEKSDDKVVRRCIDTDQIDTGAQLVAGVSPPLDPEESLRIRYGQT
ncbi:hypothetical protein EI94DRAFT_1036852 [Lactarius quietus]|nr:hypothetical protein EI94DRAFT_1036852 [Lactarius quietus]